MSDYNINIVKIKNIYCALLVEVKTIDIQLYSKPKNLDRLLIDQHLNMSCFMKI